MASGLLGLLLALPALGAAPRSLPPFTPPLHAGPARTAAAALADPPAVPGLPPFVRVEDPHDAAWIASAFREARASKTARRALREVQAAAERLGRPVIVRVRPAPYDSYNYDHNVVTIKASLRSGSILTVSSLLVHELLHFVQKHRDFPVDAFELELESYNADMMVSRELGHTPPKGSWEEDRYKKFAGPLEGYIGWLKDELYKDDDFVSRMGMRAYREELQRRSRSSRRRIKRQASQLNRSLRVLSLMHETGQDPGDIERFRQDIVSRRERKLTAEWDSLRWVERNIRLLSDPKTRRRFSAYLRRVMKRLERLHAEYRAGGGSW